MLERLAQEWTDACVWTHRDFSDVNNNDYEGFVGQQLYFSSSDFNIEVLVKVRSKHFRA